MFDLVIEMDVIDNVMACYEIEEEINEKETIFVAFQRDGKLVNEMTFTNNWKDEEIIEFVNEVYEIKSSKRRYKHGKIECIEALRECLSKEEFKGFCKGNVIKYLWRSDYKGGREDLEKAKDYLSYLLEVE